MSDHTLRPGCEARQVSDQYICNRCGLVWDMNDPEPPECGSVEVVNVGTHGHVDHGGSKVVGLSALTAIKENLNRE